jgi:hypothetical protein
MVTEARFALALSGANPRRAGLARRLLGSPVLALLLGPHGVDRYLELINPRLTIAEGRGEIVAVDRATPRSVTLTVRANAAWDGFAAVSTPRSGPRSTVSAARAPTPPPARSTRGVTSS